MKRTIDDSIKLFDSNINRNYWEDRSVIPNLKIENYSDILLNEFALVGSNKGRNERFGYNISSNYYFNVEKNIAVAQTISSRKVSAPEVDRTLVSKMIAFSQVSISTYYDCGGTIVQLNRFDYKGHPHENKYYIYDANVRDLYEKYFTSYIDTDGVPKARTPHLHFATRQQAINLPPRSEPNAISLDNVSKYLEDLLNGADERLKTFDLGMPFLKFYKQDVKYSEAFFNYLQDFVATNEVNDVTLFMKHLINRYKSLSDGGVTGEQPNSPPARPSTGGVASILCVKRDIDIYRILAKHYPRKTRLMTHLGKVLLNSLTFNKTIDLTIEKETDYVN